MNRLSALRIVSLVLIIASTSCAKIYTGNELDSDEIEHIREIGLLDSNEKIYQFYSNHNGVKGAGNFYTTKRIAHYWHYQRDKQNESAYYKDIARIDTTYHPYGDFVIPFVTITKRDSTQFKVYVDGDDAEIKSFFDNCIVHWHIEK